MKVQVIIESDEDQQRVEEVASLTRGALSADTLGLRLAEVKKVLRSLQQTMVTQQVKEFLDQPRRTRSFSPLVALLPERTAPELAYLEAKWASLMSYGLTVNLLT